jgi:hypothetical protein
MKARALRVDPEDPLGLPAASMIEWYRVDAVGRIRVVLGAACLAMCVGSLGVAGFVVRRAPFVRAPRWPMAEAVELTSGELALGLLGLAVVLTAGLLTLFTLPRILTEERYIALRVDGLLVVDGGARRFEAWDKIGDVRADHTGVHVELEDGTWTVSERFGGIEWPALAQHIAHVRRRALFGMYGSR